MQNKSKLLCLIAASLIAGTAAASAQTYDRFGNPVGWHRSGPRHEPVQPRAMYYPGTAGPYGAVNGTQPSNAELDAGRRRP